MWKTWLQVGVVEELVFPADRWLRPKESALAANRATSWKRAGAKSSARLLQWGRLSMRGMFGFAITNANGRFKWSREWLVGIEKVGRIQGCWFPIPLEEPESYVATWEDSYDAPSRRCSLPCGKSCRSFDILIVFLNTFKAHSSSIKILWNS